MRIALYTLGCKLNQAETDELKENLQNEGFFIVDWKNKADIYIVNACSLTSKAEQGTRQIIRQACRKNQKAKIFVTGCFEQNIPEVDSYIQNQQKLIKKIKFIAKNTLPKKQRDCFTNTRNNIESRTRALIKIQTGCDNYCSFCIIPRFRGKPKSISAKKIINLINQKVAEGFKEIVLTGVNICKYNDHHMSQFNVVAKTQNYNQFNLLQLIQKILNETKIQRIRFSSLDPSLIDDSFISIFHNPRIMTHMHLSLQSGSDRILKLMNRKYNAKQYLLLVKKIKKQFPYMGFTTDVIVGFPGETEKDFQDTCNLIKKVGFLKVHIFPYSPRPNTLAKNLPHQINQKIKKERSLLLKKISKAVSEHFAKKMLGQNVSVLFEEKHRNDWLGYAPNYLRIRLKSKENLRNKIRNIKIAKKNLFQF